jgi:hypothetical protein
MRGNQEIAGAGLSMSSPLLLLSVSIPIGSEFFCLESGYTEIAHVQITRLRRGDFYDSSACSQFAQHQAHALFGLAGLSLLAELFGFQFPKCK